MCHFVFGVIWKLYLFMWARYGPKKCPKSPQIWPNCKNLNSESQKYLFIEAAWPAMKMKWRNKSISEFLSRYGPNMDIHGYTRALKKKNVQQLYFLSANSYLRMLCHIPMMKYKCNFVLAMIWKLYSFTWVCYKPKKCPKSPQREGIWRWCGICSLSRLFANF